MNNFVIFFFSVYVFLNIEIQDPYNKKTLEILDEFRMVGILIFLGISFLVIIAEKMFMASVVTDL